MTQLTLKTTAAGAIVALALSAGGPALANTVTTSDGNVTFTTDVNAIQGATGLVTPDFGTVSHSGSGTYSLTDPAADMTFISGAGSTGYTYSNNNYMYNLDNTRGYTYNFDSYGQGGAPGYMTLKFAKPADYFGAYVNVRGQANISLLDASGAVMYSLNPAFHQIGGGSVFGAFLNIDSKPAAQFSAVRFSYNQYNGFYPDVRIGDIAYASYVDPSVTDSVSLNASNDVPEPAMGVTVVLGMVAAGGLALRLKGSPSSDAVPMLEPGAA